MAVARPLPGAPGGQELFLEAVDAAAMLDAEVRRSASPGLTTVAGLDHLEGRSVVLYIDGGDAGDALVSDGAVALPFEPLREVRIGSLFIPRFRSLPGVLQEDPRAGSSHGVRVGEIAFLLGPTAGLRAGLVDGTGYAVPLKRRPDVRADAGPGEEVFTGWTRLQGVQGFRDEAQIEWSQPRPGPLEVKALVLTVDS